MSVSKPLAGKAALVAGATRGAGRGIAVALGEAGATVYCSGRSTKGSHATPGRPETIEETAGLVTKAGGRGIAVRCDHTVEADVDRLVARIRAEQDGRLDVLVNDVWGGDELVEWGKPFWEIPHADVRILVERAVLSHVLTAQKTAPLLLESAGLLVEVTDGDGWQYRGQFLYDLVKMSVIRLTFAFHEEFQGRAHAVAVTPGFLRSEAMLARFGVTEKTWHEHTKVDPDWAESETPLFVGRAVAALAADPGRAARSGRVFASWTLSRDYGFTDADGHRPDWGRHFAARYGDVHRPAGAKAYWHWEGHHELMEAVRDRQANDAKGGQERQAAGTSAPRPLDS